MVKALGRMAAAVGAATLLFGCASTSRVYVRSTSQTNDGNTLYMMVRAADRSTAAEEYQEVASRLFAEPPDPTVLASQPLFPGNSASVTLDENSKKDVVIYFFFTEPGPRWRVTLPRPLPAEVFIDLGPKDVVNVQFRRR
jgi:hypothetical protein